MRMYTALYLASRLSRYGYLGSLGGSSGACEKAVAQRPEPLANHWPQLLRWTERQAPNVNIGGCIAEHLCLGGLGLHDLPLFPFSGILIASRRRLPPPRFPW